MGDPLKKVQPGQALDIPAAAHNAFVDAARAHKAQAGGLGQPKGPGAGSYVVLPVKNSSGADRDRFDVLGIDDVLYDPTENLEEFKSRPAIDGVTPATASHVGKFVILLEPIPSTRIGRGLLMGVTPVKVNFGAADDTHADVADGQEGYLASGSSGAATILWKEDGTGEKWALVNMGGHDGSVIQFGKTVGAFSSGPYVTLDPCSDGGVDNGLPNVKVNLQSRLGQHVYEPIPADTVMIWLRYAAISEQTGGHIAGVLIGIHQGTYNNPLDLAQGIGDTSADSTTWTKGNQGAYDGVSINRWRVATYDHGDGTLTVYIFRRTQAIDSAGHTTSLGAESLEDSFTVTLAGGGS